MIPAAAFWAWSAAASAAQVPSVEREEEPSAGWELGVIAGALHVDGDFARAADAQWAPAVGARLAWRPGPLVALGVEAWRAPVERGGAGGEGSPAPGPLWGFGAHLRITPWADRGWPADPALYFGLEGLTAGDDEKRSPAFVAGAGVVRLSARWTLDVAALNRHLSVEEDPIRRPDGGSVKAARDASLWEVRAGISLALGDGRG